MVTIFKTRDKDQLRNVKTFLKSQRIPFRVLHEYRVHPELDYGEGGLEEGAEVQVETHEAESAHRLLVKKGFIDVYDVKKDRYKLYAYVEGLTANVPVLGRLRGPYRFLVFLATLTALFIGVLLFLVIDLSKVDFYETYHCVEGVYFHGVLFEDEIIPSPTDPGVEQLFAQVSMCSNSSLSFLGSTHIELPNHNSAEYRKLGDGRLEIKNAERHPDVYNGLYKIRNHWTGWFSLVSEHTTIKLSRP